MAAKFSSSFSPNAPLFSGVKLTCHEVIFLHRRMNFHTVLRRSGHNIFFGL